ncbi:MAG: hypothetical protein AB7O45_17740, partial [Alphaproteobacteria bacterium]
EKMAPLHGFLDDADRRHVAAGAPAAWQPAWYAFGQFIAEPGKPPAARLAWHSGTWGVPPDTVGMLAMQHASGASWFVWYTPRPRKEATDALLERLAALPAQIATWPSSDLFAGHGLVVPGTR